MTPRQPAAVSGASARPCVENLQYPIGFAPYGGNEPERFREEVADAPVFTTPMCFVGMRF